MKIIIGGRNHVLPLENDVPRLRRDIPFHVAFIPERGDGNLWGLKSIFLMSHPQPILRHSLTSDTSEQNCIKCSGDGRACVELLDQNIWYHNFEAPAEISNRVRCQQGHLPTRSGFFTLCFEFGDRTIRTKGFRVCGAGEKKRKRSPEPESGFYMDCRNGKGKL